MKKFLGMKCAPVMQEAEKVDGTKEQQPSYLLEVGFGYEKLPQGGIAGRMVIPLYLPAEGVAKAFRDFADHIEAEIMDSGPKIDLTAPQPSELKAAISAANN